MKNSLTFQLLDQKSIIINLFYCLNIINIIVIREKRQFFGFELFSLTYQVDFPASLVIKESVLREYQFIFRMLFWFKYVERQVYFIDLFFFSTKN